MYIVNIQDINTKQNIVDIINGAIAETNIVFIEYEFTQICENYREKLQPPKNNDVTFDFYKNNCGHDEQVKSINDLYHADFLINIILINNNIKNNLINLCDQILLLATDVAGLQYKNITNNKCEPTSFSKTEKKQLMSDISEIYSKIISDTFLVLVNKKEGGSPLKNVDSTKSSKYLLQYNVNLTPDQRSSFKNAINFLLDYYCDIETKELKKILNQLQYEKDNLCKFEGGLRPTQDLIREDELSKTINVSDGLSKIFDEYEDDISKYYNNDAALIATCYLDKKYVKKLVDLSIIKNINIENLLLIFFYTSLTIYEKYVLTINNYDTTFDDNNCLIFKKQDVNDSYKIYNNLLKDNLYNFLESVKSNKFGEKIAQLFEDYGLNKSDKKIGIIALSNINKDDIYYLINIKELISAEECKDDKGNTKQKNNIMVSDKALPSNKQNNNLKEVDFFSNFVMDKIINESMKDIERVNNKPNEILNNILNTLNRKT